MILSSYDPKCETYIQAARLTEKYKEYFNFKLKVCECVFSWNFENLDLFFSLAKFANDVTVFFNKK